MKRVWDRIHVWLAANAPLVLASLRPGATEEQIRAAERELGVTLPEDVKACYRIHDGQNDYDDGYLHYFLHGQPWCSLERMVREWRTLNGWYRGARHDPDYHPHFIPLTANVGVLYLLALVPRHGGRTCEIRFGDTNAGFHSTPVADRFEEWFEAFAADLDHGRYGVHPEFGDLLQANT